MDRNYYAFTVKDNHSGRMPQQEDYEKWMHNARNHGFDIQCHYYELDKKGRLHVHGVAIAKKNFYKKSVSFNGYGQKIDAIPSWMDLQRWTDYITKDYINDMEYEQMLVQYEIQTSEDPFNG